MYQGLTKLQWWQPSEESALQRHVSSFVRGGVTASVATTLTYPFDIVRTRFAGQGVPKVLRELGCEHVGVTRG